MFKSALPNPACTFQPHGRFDLRPRHHHDFIFLIELARCLVQQKSFRLNSEILHVFSVSLMVKIHIKGAGEEQGWSSPPGPLSARCPISRCYCQCQLSSSLIQAGHDSVTNSPPPGTEMTPDTLIIPCLAFGRTQPCFHPCIDFFA